MRRIVIATLLHSALLCAAPQLRLSSSAIGPMNIAAGTNPGVQTITVSNIGDGTLTLSASVSVPWISAAISGASIQITLNTATLPKGIVTGNVTVSAPGAIDSPQTVTVTALIGGGIPDSYNLFLYPGGVTDTIFSASNQLIASGVAPAGLFLEVGSAGSISWPGTAPYDVHASASASVTPETSYAGSIVVASSGFTPDVKTVPVTFNVTNLPIASVLTSLQFNATQGAAPVSKWIPVRNLGLNGIAVNSVAVSSGAQWLTAQITGSCVSSDVAACVVAKGDPTGLAPGKYTGTLTIATNARNGPSTVAVEMDVVAVGAPVSVYQSVADNAVYFVNQPVAPGGLVLVRGDQFTLGPAVTAQTVPLATTLGGATVYVNDVPAPIYYVSGSHVTYPNGQITFQIPYETPAAQATVRVDRNDNGVVQTGNTISVQVASTAPKLMQFNFNGTEYAVATFSDGVTFPIPASTGVASRPATAGDVLVFYGLGFGQTVPAASDGVAASYSTIANAQMIFGTGAGVAPAYCGLTPGSVGLYQVNVTVPASSPKGSAVPVSLSVGGVISNSVLIAVQ